METNGLILAESAAIVEYILAKFGNGRLQHGPDHPGFAPYLYWFHFANGNLQPVIMRALTAGRCGLANDHPTIKATQERLAKVLALMNDHLSRNACLAGDAFTAADIMTVFSLTTMCLFYPIDLAPYPAIRTYLQRMGERPAYRRAMAKGDPDLTPMLA
ncbi:glutathione S-transferase family protein [Robbsia andropogonis]|uniref:glutathione S-transferase family protein n=1 Tax=Robbsia andropogonis TaxID=28092 RepID=UPI003D22C1EF